jgi:hypothetical protein
MNDTSFKDACRSGYLIVAQQLYSLIPKDMCERVDKERLFIQTCENGHLGVAKWLYTLIPKDVRDLIDIEYIFTQVCINNYLEVAKWLYSLEGVIDIHINEEYIFGQACIKGYLPLAQWLYSLEDVDIYAEENDVFTPKKMMYLTIRHLMYSSGWRHCIKLNALYFLYTWR